jgi:two-component system capsular synthesis response regulator RcsB
MVNCIKLVIVEDHQSIIDGYLYRLSGSDVEIVAVSRFGEEIETILSSHAVDVLLLDIYVPTSPANPNPFPVLHLLPKLIASHPRLKILAISMLKQRSLIEALVEAGITGYIFKEDYDSIQQLADVVKVIARGGVFFSPGAYNRIPIDRNHGLTPRQMEALSLCAAYPDLDISILARQLDISASTFRNLLSSAYKRLGVQTRTAAINKAYQMGILTPPSISLLPASGKNT